MKKLPICFILFIVFLLIPWVILANETNTDEPVDRIAIGGVINNLPDPPLSKIQEDSSIEMARRGCCSHHGGVCGCDSSSDRIICCDGTLSPSCTCSNY